MVTLALAECADHDTIIFVTRMGEAYTLTYCQEGHTDMPASLTKKILFGTLTHDKVRYQWPVAAFNDDKSARAYVTYLNLAHRANDALAIAALDPDHPVKDGHPIPGHPKWSLTTVRYAPLPALDESDGLETGADPTS